MLRGKYYEMDWETLDDVLDWIDPFYDEIGGYDGAREEMWEQNIPNRQHLVIVMG